MNKEYQAQNYQIFSCLQGYFYAINSIYYSKTGGDMEDMGQQDEISIDVNQIL